MRREEGGVSDESRRVLTEGQQVDEQEGRTQSSGLKERGRRRQAAELMLR
jgi:hypothetical protein